MKWQKKSKVKTFTNYYVEQGFEAILRFGHILQFSTIDLGIRSMASFKVTSLHEYPGPSGVKGSYHRSKIEDRSMLVPAQDLKQICKFLFFSE